MCAVTQAVEEDGRDAHSFVLPTLRCTHAANASERAQHRAPADVAADGADRCASLEQLVERLCHLGAGVVEDR